MNDIQDERPVVAAGSADCPIDDYDFHHLPDTVLNDYIPVRSSFKTASQAAKKFAQERNCEVALKQRDAPLEQYWMILAPALHVWRYEITNEIESSGEPTGEVARLMEYEQKEAMENQMGGFDDPWWIDKEFDNEP